MPKAKDAPARTGLAVVLSGGGARGAYEAGVLSVIVPRLVEEGHPPQLLIGSSVGALNAVGFAALWHHGPEEAVQRGLAIWRSVDKSQVIKPILTWQVPITALRYAGGILSLPKVRVPSLLDPQPLRENLRRWIDWAALHRNLRRGLLTGVGVVTTSAATGRPVVFTECNEPLASRLPALRSHAISYLSCRLTPEHVRASAAIPILFPPVHVHTPRAAAGWYIDGGTRLNTPLKPALDLGAERLLIVGMDSVAEPGEPGTNGNGPPDFGDGALHVLQGRLVDPMIDDVRMLGNVNTFFASDPAANRYRQARGKPPYRAVPYIFISPEKKGAIGELATAVFKQKYGGLGTIKGLHRLKGLIGLRDADFHLLNRLLGGDSPTHGELLSYLFFDPDFIDALIELGREDARAWIAKRHDGGGIWQVGPLDTFVEEQRRERVA
jgi:NTE family protein